MAESSHATIGSQQVMEIVALAKHLQNENGQLKEQQKEMFDRSQLEQLVLLLHEAQQEARRYKSRANQYELTLKRAQERFNSMSSGGNKKLEGLIVPGVSKEVFEDLVRDNTRMKRQLDQLLKDRGQDMKSFMSAQNSDDLLKSVKEQLEQKDKEISMMKETIRDARNSDGKVQAEHLADKLTALQKSDQIKSTWLDLFRQENERLHKEMMNMREELKQGKQSLQQEKADHVDGRMLQFKKDSKTTVGSGDMHLKVQQLQERLQFEKEQFDRELLQMKRALDRESQLRQQAESSTQGQFGSSQGDIQALQKKVNDLTSQLQRAVEENAAISAQSDVYKEDFEAEQQERNSQKTDYEAKLKQMQDFINKLSSECESLNSMLSRERFEKTQFKRQIESMQRGPAVYGMPAAACSRQVHHIAIPPPQVGLQPGLMARGSPTAPNPYNNQAGPWMNQLPQMVAVDSADGARQDSGESGSGGDDRRVCPRCEREFFDQAKFEDHVQRCIDS